MSLLDLLEVPLAQSRISSSPVDRPRVTASRAQPLPTTPPPMTRTSSSPLCSAAIVSSRAAGDIVALCISDLDPVEGALDGLLPAAVPGLALLGRPGGPPAVRLVPV